MIDEPQSAREKGRGKEKMRIQKGCEEELGLRLVKEE